MEILFFALALLVAGGINIACFLFGAKVGQTVAAGKPVELPNPVKSVKEAAQERTARKEQEYQQKQLDLLLENIENYDGSANGQKDIPM